MVGYTRRCVGRTDCCAECQRKGEHGVDVDRVRDWLQESDRGKGLPRQAVRQHPAGRIHDCLFGIVSYRLFGIVSYR